MSPEQEKLFEREIKLRAYVACGWVLIVLFAMVGVILGRPAGVYVGLIAAVMWVLNRIIREAFDALRLLQGIKAATPTKSEDNKLPPGPPASA